MLCDCASDEEPHGRRSSGRRRRSRADADAARGATGRRLGGGDDTTLVAGFAELRRRLDAGRRRHAGDRRHALVHDQRAHRRRPAPPPRAATPAKRCRIVIRDLEYDYPGAPELAAARREARTRGGAARAQCHLGVDRPPLPHAQRRPPPRLVGPGAVDRRVPDRRRRRLPRLRRGLGRCGERRRRARRHPRQRRLVAPFLAAPGVPRPCRLRARARPHC